MTRPVEGLKNEALRAALLNALRGDVTRLEQLLVQHGGLRGRNPNVKLAAAFGAEVARLPGSLAPLLGRLAADDSAPDSERSILPVAAAHGWAHRLREGHEVEPAWQALLELAADARSPVRVGTLDALIGLALREGGADTLIERATGWLEAEDRETCFNAAALVIEALDDSRVLTIVRDHERLLEYLSSAIDKVANASRASARSDGRRRLLSSLASTLASVVALVRSNARGFAWFQAECERATHPDVRATLSRALVELSSNAHAPSGAVVESLRQTLEGSAKPMRDPTRMRPGTGRGRKTRPTR